MKLGLVRGTNFLRLGSAELNLYRRGAILVQGENRDEQGANAACKSTFLDLICWGLQGRTIRGVVGANVSILGPTEVVIDAEEIDGQWYRIYRTAHKKTHELSVHTMTPEGAEGQVVIRVIRVIAKAGIDEEIGIAVVKAVFNNQYAIRGHRPPVVT